MGAVDQVVVMLHPVFAAFYRDVGGVVVQVDQPGLVAVVFDQVEGFVGQNVRQVVAGFGVGE